MMKWILNKRCVSRAQHTHSVVSEARTGDSHNITDERAASEQDYPGCKNVCRRTDNQGFK